MNELLKELPQKKIQINWNKEPIPMKLFVSFLTVEVEKSTNHLGSDTGWTKYTGADNLIIKGGVVGGVEFLDSIKYKKQLDNQYNDFVSPFYLFEILTPQGQQFFLNYYREDIEHLLVTATSEHARLAKAAEMQLQRKQQLADLLATIDNQPSSWSTFQLSDS